MTWQFVEVMHNKKQTLLFQDYVDLNKVGDVYAQQHLVGGEVQHYRPFLSPTL